jgi:ornithine decarboxylase
MLQLLAALGAGFDCASKAEIQTILNNKLVDPSRIIYANPCKTRSFIKFAADQNVKLMTFDNEEELLKIIGLHENPE